MSAFAIAKDIEGDLKQIISEASLRRTIPHVKDRAERAVVSISAATDKTSLDRAVEEVLSTLLIATEVGSVPKLILVSLSVLQKLAVSNVISSETFLHMITVLCKATSSVSGVLSGSQSSPSAAEVESAQLRCLQTLHLLQVDELASYFLNEIALSQVISMCTNLMNSASCSSVVSQAASAAVSQLIIFTTETTARIEKGTKSEAVLILPPIFNAMGELNGLVSVLAGQSLLLLVHDLITMCAPDLTRHMFCQIFGSSRIRPQQALEILCDFFDPSSSPHLVEIKGIDTLLTNYMIPVMSKFLTISEEQVTRETRLILRLFVKLCRISAWFPQISSSLNKVFVQLNNFILDENLTPPKRIIFTETITCSIASNSWTTVFSSLNYSSSSTLPLGGDSPVAKGANPQRDGASITESIIDSVCLFLHRSEFISESLVAGLSKLGIKTINEGTGSNGFTLLFSNADLSASTSSGSSSSYNMMIIGVSLDLILSFIDVVSKNKDKYDGLFIRSYWTSLLSCLLLLVNNAGLDPSGTVPGVLAGIEKLIFILAYADSREGVEACVASLLKVKNINKFLLNLFHRMSCDHTVLLTVSVDIWRSVIRQFEIIAFDSSSSPGFNRPEDLLVQTIAMEAFFSMASSEAAVNKLVEALLPPFPCADWNSLSIFSPWTVSKLSQMLRSEWGLKCLPNIWTDKVGPALTALRRIMNDFNLTEDLLAGGRRNSASSSAVCVSALSLCFSITECVADLVKTSSLSSPSITHLILESGVEFANLVPLKTVEAIHGIVESVGHLLDENGWKVVIDCLQLVAGDKSISAPLFKLIELIIEEHSSAEKQQTGKLVRILHNLTISSHHQLAVTTSFKAISLVLKCSEQSAVTCSAWEEIHSFFLSAVLDQRAEVRNCAIRTLGAVAFPPLVVLEMAKSVIVCAAEKFNEPATPSDIVSGLIVHHSRDSEEKRWSESVVLVLQAVFSSFKAVSGPDDMEEFVDSETLAQVLDLCLFLPSSAQEEKAWSDEVVVASVKFFVDIWRACTWIDAHVFLNVIRKEVDRNKQNTMSRSITLLLPVLVPIMTETGENSLSAIFHLFAVAITHPSLHLPNAVPYLARRPPTQTQGDYARETEAFKCVVAESLESGGGPIYRSTEESKKLIPFLSLLFSSINLPLVCFKDLVALLLDTDLIFRNSFTLAMAILTIEMGLKEKNRFSNNVMRSALCQIAQTRNGPVAIASTCLWKLAIQALIILGNHDEQKQLSDLVVLLPLQQPADPIDYALFDFIAVQGDDDKPEFILYVGHQLELLAHQHDLFRMYILLSLLQPQREESSEEEVTFFSSARLICGNNDDVVNEETIAGLKKASNLTPNQFLPQLITCVSALFHRCDSSETAVVAVLKSNLPRALVKGSWESIATNLITTESLKIRTRLRALLLSLGTPDDIF